jgi:uncharacterized repeat protein (TIGR03803 family)
MESSLSDQASFIFRDLRYSTTYYARAKSDISTKFGPAAKFKTRTKIPQKRLWGLTTSAGAHDAGTVFSFSVDSATFTKHHDYIETSDYPNAYLDGSLTPAPEGGFFGNSECERNGTCGNGEIFYISALGGYKLLTKPGLHEGGVMLGSNNQLYVVDDWINYFQGGILKLPAGESQFDLSKVMFRIRSKGQGQNPQAPLIELRDGFLYGMAPYGGQSNHGVIFKIKLDGTGFQVIHNFDSAISGANPNGSLLPGSDGHLYGTTTSGGQFNQGIIFKILPDGTSFKKLLDFSGSNGSQPNGNLVERNKKLFGAAPAGGDQNRGVIFSINLDGSGYRKLFSFNGINGEAPVTPTIVDLYIFGMTSLGGVNGNGVIYKMKLDGTSFEKLHEFSASHGARPTGGLLLSEDFFPAAASSALKTTETDGRLNTNSYAVGIFPNPFINSFTADITSENDHAVRIIVTDLQGGVVTETTSTTNGSVSMGDDLRKGIYVLKVIKGKEVSLHRIVKK